MPWHCALFPDPSMDFLWSFRRSTAFLLSPFMWASGLSREKGWNTVPYLHTDLYTHTQTPTWSRDIYKAWQSPRGHVTEQVNYTLCAVCEHMSTDIVKKVHVLLNLDHLHKSQPFIHIRHSILLDTVGPVGDLYQRERTAVAYLSHYSGDHNCWLWWAGKKKKNTLNKKNRNLQPIIYTYTHINIHAYTQLINPFSYRRII